MARGKALYALNKQIFDAQQGILVGQPETILQVSQIVN
jgi:hypothetical protein